ncbi:25127_t:CDS:1, partial [Dentiscutata erythropus]
IYQSRFLLAAFKCWKVILRIYTNTTELSRICSNAVIETGIVSNDLNDLNDSNDRNDDSSNSSYGDK